MCTPVAGFVFYSSTNHWSEVQLGKDGINSQLLLWLADKNFIRQNASRR